MKNRRKSIGLLLLLILLITTYLLVDNFLFDGYKGRKIAENGFQATYFAKQEIKEKPAIIILGGGQGGEYWAKKFADQGWASLSLPYYRQAGLPPLMEEIPLEYFERALNWLQAQAEVHPEKIMLMGASRNAELALVIASQYPELVRGVIAYAPSAISWSNTVLPFNSDTLKPSWTYLGQDIPYLPMDKIKGPDAPKIETLEYWMSGLQRIDQHKEAIIKVEKINGPILLLSGKEDNIWPAALMSDMIEQRLKENDFQYEFENIQYEQAGHLISRNIANISNGRIGQMLVDGKTYEFEFGGTIEGDKQAIYDSQEKIMSFIQKFDSQ